MTASQELQGQWVPFELSRKFNVPSGEKVVDIRLQAVVSDLPMTREIQLSASATTSAQATAEVKAGVEAEANELLASSKLSGEVGLATQFAMSGTLGAGQTVSWTMTFRRITGFKLLD